MSAFQTPRRNQPQKGPPPSTDPRRMSGMGAPGATSTPRARNPDVSGIFTPGRDRQRIPDQGRDMKELLKAARDSTKTKHPLSEVWNLALIDYFKIEKFSTTGGRVNYSVAADALNASTDIYRKRVEFIKQKANTLASHMGSGKTARADDDEPMDLEIKPKRRKKAGDAPIIAKPEKIQLKHNTHVNTVDPLFRKTQVEYDKGNYKALLLATMVPDIRGRLSFEDFPLESQITNKNPLILRKNKYFSEDIDEYKSMFASDFEELSMVPMFKQLKEVMDLNKNITGLNEADGTEYVSEIFADASYYPEENINNQFEDDDFGNYQAQIIPNLDDNIPFMQPNIITENLLNRINPSRQKQLQLTITRQKDSGEKPTDTKPKKSKHKIVTEIDVDALRKKVFAKAADPSTLELAESQFQRRMRVLESIDLRDFYMLHIRPGYVPLTMKRVITKIKSVDTKNGEANDDQQPERAPEPNHSDEYHDYQDDNLEDYVPEADEVDPIGMDHNVEVPDELYNMEFTDDDESLGSDEDDDFYEHQGAAGHTFLQRNVDVATFKDNIWSDITAAREEKGEEVVEREGITMDGIMKETVQKYKENASHETKDLVGPLFFLNLLHLANEKGIRIECAGGYKEENIMIFPPDRTIMPASTSHLEDDSVFDSSVEQTPTKKKAKRKTKKA